MSSKTVAEVLANRMWEGGAREIFAQSLPSALILAAEKRGIRQVSYRTENAGGAMADGFARASNKVTFVGAQNGPAATLLVPPLYEAMLVSIPVVALVQEVPVSSQDKNAFQEIDHVELFSGCSKWTKTITDPNRAEEYIDAAIRVAVSGKPGPVVLLLPKDILIEEVIPTNDPRSVVSTTFPIDRPQPTQQVLTEAANLISQASKPVVVAGGGVNRAQAQPELKEFQELTGIPVATTNMGKGSVDERHPLSMGVVGNAMGERSSTRHMESIIRDADLVVLVGNRTNENGTDGWKLFPADANYIHIDASPEEIGRNYSAMRLVGDAKATLAALNDTLNDLSLEHRASFREAAEMQVAVAKDNAAKDLELAVDENASPIRPERVMNELDALAPSDAIFVADASYSTIWLSNYVTADGDRQFHYPRGMAGLGWGLPMAIGAKVAHPDRPVICITGDGGFGHVWQEMETAVRMSIPLVVVLLNNGILGFQTHSELFQFSEHTSAVNFASVDHAAIAKAVGARGVRLTDPEDLADTIQQSLNADGPTLIEVMSDPDAYPPITLWESRSEVLPTSKKSVLNG